MEGFILLHRKILKDWEWYSNINDRIVFIHCLLRANWEDGWFEGVKIPRGSFATSYKNLAKEVGISVHQLRTSLEHLKMTNNVAHETNKQFSIITIKNYNKYQVGGTPNDNRVANEWQTSGNNIIKNNKENNKESISKDIPKKVFVKPTIQEIIDYCKERNNNVIPEKFYNFYESKGWYVGKNKMKDWKACVRTWEQHDNKQDNSKLPDWWDKEYEIRRPTDEEQRELDELIRGY